MLHLRFALFLLMGFCWVQCQENQEKPHTKIVVENGIQQILDSANVKGIVLIYDTEHQAYTTNDTSLIHQAHLPASTFKIANSIIALETGIVDDDSTLIIWDGQQRYLDSWEQDLVFRDAFHLSCVPCYQEIARKIGVQQMRTWLDTLQYELMTFDSTTLDMFWLRGQSQISPYQQIDFLRRLHERGLPVSDRTYSIFKRMMISKIDSHGILRSKTGWSNENGNHNGWYVGYLDQGEKVIFFATNIEPQEEFDMSKFGAIRIDITNKALELLY